VTGSTQAHEVSFGVGAAFGERYDMVDFLGGRQLVGFGTFPTQRVRGNVPVTDTLPRSAIAFACGRITVIFVVLLVSQFLVRFAVPSVCQRRTTGMATRTFWFLWHKLHLPGKQKALGAGCSKGFLAFAQF